MYVLKEYFETFNSKLKIRFLYTESVDVNAVFDNVKKLFGLMQVFSYFKM